MSLMVGLLGLVSCASDTGRSAGTPCTQEECEANLCFDDNCIDAPVSQDDDYLTVEEEAVLQTEFSNPDTDGDGWIDGLEVVFATAPHDEDGDGLHDALESMIEDQDGDCLVDQKDPNNGEVETDPAVLADLGCCCYGACSDWGIDVSSASCEIGDDGVPHLICPPNLQPDQDGDGVADACDLCPADPGETCDWAPHGLRSTPESPSDEVQPTVTGHAFRAQTVDVYALDCGEETVLAESVPVDVWGRFSADVTVTEDATTRIVARARYIGGYTSGDSEPLDYTHPDVVTDAPLLEFEFDQGWQHYQVANSSEVSFRVTVGSTELPAVEWSLFPSADCTQKSTSWGSSMSGSTDKMDLGSGHINLGSSGTETPFSARVHYNDGSQSVCSDAAIYVRQSADPAVAAWLVDPVDTMAKKQGVGNTNDVIVRVAVTDGVTEVTLFAGDDCESQPGSVWPVDVSPMDVTLDFFTDLGVTLPGDAVTEVPISVMTSGDDGEPSACVSVLNYTHDPVPPPPPTLTVEADGDARVFHGTATEAWLVTVFAGLGCDSCSPSQNMTVAETGEGANEFAITWDNPPEATDYSAQATDVAGNVSACVEMPAP